ncbi:hypothetical protein [Phenylobacterium sp.]|uniref:hypothetical protein n=1 Tax=Phenylobacterium sp. TaxID=1871053 RepID=UPI002812276C|nr:hypothetical protein [Phenylobacterium sp.]
MIGVLIFAAALAAQGAEATNETGTAAAAPAPATAAPAAKAKDDPMICRNETPVGTRLARRTCAPKSVRDAHERAAKETTERIQRGGLGPWMQKN